MDRPSQASLSHRGMEPGSPHQVLKYKLRTLRIPSTIISITIIHVY